MSRRTLLKLVALLPFVGLGIAKVLATTAPTPTRVFVPYLPREFPKWNRAIDGLDSAGSWALEHERSRLPKGVTFPRAGQVWEAVRDCEVFFRAQFSLPNLRPRAQVLPATAPVQLKSLLFPFGDAQLRRGERVRILGGDGTPPLRVTFQPVRYDELQNTVIPEKMRKMPGYAGYTLSAKTAKAFSFVPGWKDIRPTLFTEAFRLVEDVA